MRYRLLLLAFVIMTPLFSRGRTAAVPCGAAVDCRVDSSQSVAAAGANLSEAASPAPLTRPAGVDLDVTYVSRTPMYNRYEVWYSGGKPYLRPGTESQKRWPESGETVTFTAHVRNKGTVSSGSFGFKWYVDGAEVQSGVHASLAAGQEGTEVYQWTWAHTVSPDGQRLMGQHTIKFVADPANAVAETYETNNSLEDRTDAVSLVMAIRPDIYAALETPIDPDRWAYSAEDWLQRQAAAMNQAFMDSAPPIEERVRIDKIIVTDYDPGTDWSEDGGWFLGGDDRGGDGAYDPNTDVSGALLHELTHQLGIIDMYNLDVALEIPQVVDQWGKPVQMEYWSWGLFSGLMNDLGARYYDAHTAHALNANKGYRRGYYGEYLYDVPQQTYLRVLDNQGDPVSDVTVKLYQRSSGPNQYGSLHGTIDNTPEITGVTDATGTLLLTNRSVGTSITTKTGHALNNNPFGVIDVVGMDDEFILELRKGTHQEYQWLDITKFNLAAWSGGGGSVNVDIASHVPPEVAPLAPSNLSAVQESGKVKLRWTASPSDVVGYNIYRTDDPLWKFERIQQNLQQTEFTEDFVENSRAHIYAVTAVGASGAESGFSNLFYAFSVLNPADIVVDDQNGRVVLAPQNGYALLTQSAGGSYLDTRGSFDLHLEFSEYMTRDSQGRLIISHPGDYYSGLHSVRVTDAAGTKLFEFPAEDSGSDTSSALGRFNEPAGVAVWEGFGPYRIIVADSSNNRIQAFDSQGNFISAYGTPGGGDGQFMNPQDVAVDGAGNVIVVDHGNNRVELLSFNGTSFGYLQTVRAGFNGPTGLAVSGGGNLIVADTGNDKVDVLDESGMLLAEYTAPNDGRTGAFNHPTGVAVDLDGNILVADSGNRRVVGIIAAAGDVNGDDQVSMVDAMLIAQYVAGLVGSDDLNLSAADVNCSGTATMVDAMLIAQKVAGLIDGFTCAP